MGLLPLVRRRPLQYLAQLAERYGDVVCFRSGTQRFFLLNHPDYIKDLLVTSARKFAKGRALERAKILLGDGLLTSEGDLHLRQRRLLQPAFHHQRILAYAGCMVEHATRMCESWRAGTEIDIHEQMTRLTLGIVGKTLFDAEMEGDSSEVIHAINEAFSLFHLLMFPYAEFVEKLPFSPVRRVHRANARLDAVMYRIIDERRKEGHDHGDLLSMLLQAQDSDAEGGSGPMNDKQLRDECLTLFLAGHETTANALTWVWYLLAQHPTMERRVHEEIDSVLNGRKPSADDVGKLVYLEMVVAEALRMYPPAWIVGRRALEEHKFGPYKVPLGSLVAASQWVTHHDKRFFPEPYVFNPERWTPDARAARPKYCYFPFAAGPRQCIGEGFAWMEAILLLATIAQRWKLELAAGQKIELKPVVTLRPKNGVRVIVRPR